VSALLFIPWFKLEGYYIPNTEIGLQPFGVLVAIGVLAGARMAEWRGVRLGLKRELVADCIFHVVGFGFVLGHVFDMVLYTPERLTIAPWELLFFWKSLSSYGGFFGSAIGGLIWRYRRGYLLTPVYDQIAFGLSLGWLFGRLGCFVVHDHPGKITDFFLAVDEFHYPGLPIAPRHDLGLYEVFWAAVVVPLFFWLDRKPRPHGFFIGLITILYAPARFFLDFLREADKTYFGLTPGHYSSILALLLGIYMMWRAYKRPITNLPKGMLANPDTEPKKP
jgi:phosphatidylglycerol:prolipoprotein diacylglycerol transferase